MATSKTSAHHTAGRNPAPAHQLDQNLPDVDFGKSLHEEDANWADTQMRRDAAEAARNEKARERTPRHQA